MGRPEKEKRVVEPPLFDFYKPGGVPIIQLEICEMTLDEYEAIRLADYEELEHAEAAVFMNISRPTFTKLITRARKKYSRLLVEGTMLKIAGGVVHFGRNRYKCKDCHKISQSPLDEELAKCSHCGSTELEDLAVRHGHGQCCIK